MCCNDRLQLLQLFFMNISQSQLCLKYHEHQPKSALSEVPVLVHTSSSSIATDVLTQKVEAQSGKIACRSHSKVTWVQKADNTSACHIQMDIIQSQAKYAITLALQEQQSECHVHLNGMYMRDATAVNVQSSLPQAIAWFSSQGFMLLSSDCCQMSCESSLSTNAALPSLAGCQPFALYWSQLPAAQTGCEPYPS